MSDTEPVETEPVVDPPGPYDDLQGHDPKAEDEVDDTAETPAAVESGSEPEPSVGKQADPAPPDEA